MGPVSAAAVALIKKQVNDNGLVVWLDPGGELASVVELLRAEGVGVEAWAGSHFEFRKRVEPALAADTPAKLVAYVPLAAEDVALPLAELLAASVVVRPGQTVAARNTRLAIIAKAALQTRLAPDALKTVLEQVEQGKLSLLELDTIGEKAPAALDGVLAVIFKVTSIKDMAVAFVASGSHDDEVVARKGTAELAEVLGRTYGWTTKGEETPEAIRKAFVRHVLAVDCAVACPDGVLKHLPRLDDKAARDACVELADTWRKRADMREAYAASAREVGGQLAVTDEPLSFEVLRNLCTFKEHETALQSAVERKLQAGASGDLSELTTKRLEAFWAAADAEVMGRWALIRATALMLETADSIDSEIGAQRATAKDVAQAYTREDAPWSNLDTLHRDMEHLAAMFDFAPDGGHEELEKLLARARERHASVAGRVARMFVDGVVADGLEIAGFPRQLETFERFVKPAIASGKTAYILVDGLRYEMAHELTEAFALLERGRLHATIGTLPSITEVGMAALMPNAHVRPELIPAGPGKLALNIQGRPLGSRKERLEYLEAVAGIPVYTATLDAFLPAKTKVREAVKAAQLVVVTATDELDGICETGNVALARRVMHDVLQQIVRATRVLHGLDVETVVITADHGFLFGETVDSGGKIDPPGGVTHDLHRRVWVGLGGAASDSYVRFTARQVGLEGNLEIAVPRSLGCFKAPGGTLAYFHGGASPQELIVPVLVVKPERHAPQRGTVEWSLVLGSKVISSRFVSVQVSGTAGGLFQLRPTKVHVEVREGKTVLSRAVAASYGFEQASGSVTLEPAADHRSFKPDTVTLLLDPAPKGNTVSIALVEAESERTAKTLDSVPVKLAGF